MSHTRPTVNERLTNALRIQDKNMEALVTRLFVVETLVGAIIKHFDLKILDETEQEDARTNE